MKEVVWCWGDLIRYVSSGVFFLISWLGRFMDNLDIFEGKLNKYFVGWNLENIGGFD